MPKTGFFLFAYMLNLVWKQISSLDIDDPRTASQVLGGLFHAQALQPLIVGRGWKN